MGKEMRKDLSLVSQSMQIPVEIALRRSHMKSSRSVEKPWLYESLDHTISTVDSDGLSISSGEGSVSDETLVYETPTRSHNKRVSFACQADGQVQCQVKEIDRIEDLSLWWNREENNAIIQGCIEVVRHYQSRSKICTTLKDLLSFRWIDDQHPLDRILNFLEYSQDPLVPGRGLEQHIVGSSSYYVMRHREAVLSMQEELVDRGMEDSPEACRQISQAAALTSADCGVLAQELALLDEQDVNAESFQLECW